MGRLLLNYIVLVDEFDFNIECWYTDDNFVWYQ